LKQLITYLFAASSFVGQVKAQAALEDNVLDSLPASKKSRIHWAIPATLIASGTIVMLDRDGDEFFLSNSEMREERNEHFSNFSNHLDDYLQHAPAVGVFALSIAGVKGTHNLRNQAALYVKSEVMMLAMVYSLKYTVGESRPDTGQKNSFPSGHTAQAFVAATFLSKEYGSRSIWISIGAYSAATAVGAFRVLNDRHWLSDVLVGAGIGILSTEIVYRTHHTSSRPRGKQGSLRINSFSAYGASGLSLCYRL
jgi:membrane-associated phospholipid phosphatase